MKGFHLIELLTTVAMISILATLCMPLYSSYLLQARRLEAATTLSKLALAMEKFHIEHNGYQEASLAALHFPESIAKNHYHLLIQAKTNNQYTLLATPIGKQAANDQRCGGLVLHSTTRKAVTGSGSVEECWG